MCDPVTAAALAMAAVQGVAQVTGNRSATKARYSAATNNLKTNYAASSNQQDALVNMFLDGLGVRQSDGRYEESAVMVLGSEMGMDADAAAILKREVNQGTARDMNAMKQNFDSQIDEVESFKRNSLSQFKAELKGAKAQNKSANINTAMSTISSAASIGFTSMAKPTPTGG